MRGGILRDETRLRAAVEGAQSLAEILRRLGLRAAGANHAALRAACAEFDIDLPVIDRAALARKHLGKAAPRLEDILIDGISLNSGNLKRKLLSEGLLKNECSECGLADQWNGKPLVLHLDHINGNRLDNRLENLRLLCPNCHSQTPTYAGRSKRQVAPRATKRKKVLFARDELAVAIRTSSNWRQVCVALGNDISPSSYSSVQTQAAGYGLDTSHFEQSKHASVKRLWTDQDLQAALADVTAWSQVCRKLRIAPAGSNYRRLRERAELLGLDISHIRARNAPTSQVQEGGQPVVAA